jgi:predicted TIM-barrel fold metal-dependent hydrolase
MPPLWRRCQQLGAVMCVQTKWSRLPDIARLIAAFPELPVVIDHMADTPADQPAELDRLLALAQFPRVSVKISHTWWVSKQPYPHVDALALVQRLHDRFGPRRLLWGTDWPVVDRFCGYTRALEILTRHMPFISAADRAHIMGGNAARLFAA